MSPAGTVAAPSSVFRGTIRPAPMVTQVVRGDAIVLADFRHARYYTLNPVGGRIWALVRDGITLPALLAQLHDEYDAPAERIDADAVTLLEMLRAAHLITCRPLAALPASGPGDTHDLGSIERDEEALGPEADSAMQHVETCAVNRTFRVPSVLHCGVLIVVVKLALKLMGFRHTCRWIQHRTKRITVRDDVRAADITTTEYRIALAAALWPGRALCLEQSLVLYYVLRRQGVAVTYRQGVQPYPFVAHAWVEHRGQPINDVPEHVQRFAPLPEDVL